MSKGLLNRLFEHKRVEEFVAEATDESKAFVYGRKGFQEVEGKLKLEAADFAAPFDDPSEEDAVIVKLLLMAIQPMCTVTAVGGHITITAMNQTFLCHDQKASECPIKTIIINPAMSTELAELRFLNKATVGLKGSLGGFTWAAETDVQTCNGSTWDGSHPDRSSEFYATEKCPERTVIFARAAKSIGVCLESEEGKFALVILNSRALGKCNVIDDPGYDEAVRRAAQKAQKAESV